MRVGAHAAIPFGRKFGQFRDESAGLVEQFLRVIAFHPILQKLYMPRMTHVAHRHLVRAKSSLDLLAIDNLGAGPPLRRAEYDHGPARTLLEPVCARLVLDAMKVGNNGVERLRHQWMHFLRVIAFDEIGCVAVAAKQGFQFIVRQTG